MENELLEKTDRLHTTELGAESIRRNLSIDAEDITAWTREQILSPSAEILRKGKNWYVRVDDIVLTINATSYTIITAHRADFRRIFEDPMGAGSSSGR